ncbi:hypothetical protein HZV92_001798 [Salmonella enterica]|nr:hypothetical protein [Salmonella enterica]EFQ6618137.1 hypothetical protein [Salmonella enterica]
MLGRCSGSNVSGHVHMSDIKAIKSRVTQAVESNKKGAIFSLMSTEKKLPKLRSELNTMIASVKNSKHNPQKGKVLNDVNFALHKLELQFANRAANNKVAEHTHMSKYEQRKIREQDYASGDRW